MCFFLEGGGGGKRAKALLCHAGDFPSDIVEVAEWLGYSGPGNKPSTLPRTRLFLNGSLSSTPCLCFVYSWLQPAFYQLGFYTPCLFTMFGTRLFVFILRWALLGETAQLKGVSSRAPGNRTTCRFQLNYASLKLPQNSKTQTAFCFGFFRGEIDQPSDYAWFSPRKSLQNR